MSLSTLDEDIPSTPNLAATVEYWAELLYGSLLLLTLVVSAAVHSVVHAKQSRKPVASGSRRTGPGGRPLPQTRRSGIEAEEDDDDEDEPCYDAPILRTFRYASVLLVVTFVCNALSTTTHLVKSRTLDGDWIADENITYMISGLFFHLYTCILLYEKDKGPNVVQFSVWCMTLLEEVIILGSSASRIHRARTGRAVFSLDKTPAREPAVWEDIELAIACLRVASVALLAGLYFIILCRRQSLLREKSRASSLHSEHDEETPLLNHQRSGYVDPQQGEAKNEAAFYRPEKLPKKTWWEYVHGYTLFFPYLWPTNNLKLQTIILHCFIILIFQRVVNVLVPQQLGWLTNELEAGEGFPTMSISLLILYKFMQGNSGLLGCLRAWLWVPVSQYCYLALTTASFEHVHSLSLEFHTAKRTGEVLSALNKGASINNFLEQVTFQVFPMLVDLLIAIAYFLYTFGQLYATIVCIVTWYYLHMTVKMASTRADQRRAMVNADREEEAVKNDSITSYETVKYFNAEPYEFDRYRKAIGEFQVAEAQVTYGMTFMNICQSLVWGMGLLVVLMVAALQVSRKKRSVGDFMVLVTYLAQLQGPLNFFGTFYRTVQQAMISGERLLELFKIEPSVVDQPGVKALPTKQGLIRWNKVSFWYDNRKPALKELSFECKPGTTTAFVGESGGGKSTIFRLMFRYYDHQEGSIEIDGYDVKDVTIDSVRRLIGVVPQDTILFNETIMYNLKYANQNVTEEEVIEACRAASIHDRIMSFADGYNTKVGERGLRLSGGEKQRVAIARTMLKNPKIIMLDEATSALDSDTEQQIQERLIRGDDLGHDRTLLIIAHRLSTITHADQIIVLHNGGIIERGTHTELLQKGGKYSSMWEKQFQAELAAKEAKDAAERAAVAAAEEILFNNRAEFRAKQIDILQDLEGHKAKRAKRKHVEDYSDGYHSVSSSTILQTGPHTPDMGSTGRRSDDSSTTHSFSGSEDSYQHVETENHADLSCNDGESEETIKVSSPRPKQD